jgi:3'(2'), 5'-bisphosphate nucleotidase
MKLAPFNSIETIYKILELLADASDLALDYFGAKYKIYQKSDNSLVTEADIAISKLCIERLHKITPEIPIISEEEDQPIGPRGGDKSQKFWLLDPIDGTTSFSKGRKDYAISLGLIYKGKAQAGFIILPMKQLIYYTDGENIYKCSCHEEPIKLQTRISPDFDNPTLTFSINSFNNHVREFINYYRIQSIQNKASAAKFSLLIENEASVHPKFTRTMEWDTAAGHALLKACGGNIFDLEGKELLYNKPKFTNSSFIAINHMELYPKFFKNISE